MKPGATAASSEMTGMGSLLGVQVKIFEAAWKIWVLCPRQQAGSRPLLLPGFLASACHVPPTQLWFCARPREGFLALVETQGPISMQPAVLRLGSAV